ncbi:MAG: hypothetical protein EB168_09385, partial [Euryarchaeota archaeon]|nr:hypothetical protein [Euryarchaeota archaeon]
VDSVGLDSTQVLALITSTVDSAYVAARDSDLTFVEYTDSDVIALVDSAYVNARSDHYTTADHDSDTLIQVDSAYVQARQLLGGSVTVDSVAPSPASNGQLWYDPTSSVLHIRDSGEWDSINAQDSGAYLLLSGGTVTGPLNLDSGGIQLGPEGVYRSKLYTGIASLEGSWESAGGTGLGVVSATQGFYMSARNPNTGRIIVAYNQGGLDAGVSDDGGRTWTKLTGAQEPYASLGGSFNRMWWDDVSNRFWAAVGRPKNDEVDTVLQWSNDGFNWNSIEPGNNTWERRFVGARDRSDNYILTGQDPYLNPPDWISWGYDDSDNIIGFIGDNTDYIGGTSLTDGGGAVQGEGLARTVPGTVTDSSGGTWIIFGRKSQDSDGLINGGDHSIFPKEDTRGRTLVGSPIVWSNRHQEWLKVFGTTNGTDGDGSKDWGVYKSSDGGKTFTKSNEAGYDYNSSNGAGDPRGYYDFNGATGFVYSEELDVLLFYGNHTQLWGAIYTPDWGRNWFRVGFRSTTDNSVSVVGGTNYLRLREVAYNADEAYWYASGRLTGENIDRTFVSSDLQKWMIVPETVAPDADGQLRVIEHIGGNQFWRGGANLEPTFPRTGEIGTIGEVPRDFGVLKFNNETILTDSNMAEYVTPSFIEDRLPSRYELTGVSSLVLETDGDVSSV